jgi:hypothetical protein
MHPNDDVHVEAYSMFCIFERLKQKFVLFTTGGPNDHIKNDNFLIRTLYYPSILFIICILTHFLVTFRSMESDNLRSRRKVGTGFGTKPVVGPFNNIINLNIQI